MIFLHAGVIGKPTLCGLVPTLTSGVVKSPILTNCRACQKRILGNSSALTFDGFVRLGSGVFVERSAKTEVVNGKLWKTDDR